MARLVLDASAALRLVLTLEGATSIADSLENSSVVLVPQLFVSEVANGLWKYVRFGDLESEQSLERLQEALALPDEFVADRTLAVEALTEANARDHPAYDLLYVVLARRHGARVLTTDGRLADFAAAMGIGVEPGS